MKKQLMVAAWIALASLPHAHAARSAVPLVEPERVAVATAEGRSPGLEAMRAAILRGGARHGWAAREDQPGRMRLVFNKQNKHEVTVDVGYDADGFQVRYVASLGMQYASQGANGAEIHPFYNRWVTNLNTAIANEVRALP